MKTKNKYISKLIRENSKLKIEKFTFLFLFILSFILLIQIFIIQINSTNKNKNSLDNYFSLNYSNSIQYNNALLNYNLNNLNSIAFNDYFSLAFGNGNKEITLYLNPECPHSLKYIQKIKDNFPIINDNFRIKVILIYLHHLNNKRYFDILSNKSNEERVRMLFNFNYNTHIYNSTKDEHNFIIRNIPKDNLSTPTLLGLDSDKSFFNSILN